MQADAIAFMQGVAEQSRATIADRMKEISHQCMDEVSFVDKLAKVAFQVDPDFSYTESETLNPQLRFSATLSLGKHMQSLVTGVGQNKKSAKE